MVFVKNNVIAGNKCLNLNFMKNDSWIKVEYVIFLISKSRFYMIFWYNLSACLYVMLSLTDILIGDIYFPSNTHVKIIPPCFFLPHRNHSVLPRLRSVSLRWRWDLTWLSPTLDPTPLRRRYRTTSIGMWTSMMHLEWFRLVYTP